MTTSDTASELFASSKGLLAIDESVHTCNERFAKLGIAQTEATRRAYRVLLVTAAGLNQFIGGVILADETLRERLPDGTPMATALTSRGLVPGIKVDLGEHALAGHPGDQVTEGLDGLRERLVEYRDLGARFTKWRAVFTVTGEAPSIGCLEANAHGLARCAALSQEAQLVPVIEPEVLLAGTHSLEQCAELSEQVLRAVFEQLYRQRVQLNRVVLKTNMITPGADCPEPATLEQVALATVACLRRSVPAAVPAVAFLSGGQAPALASARLNAMNQRSKHPWSLAFSFARALHQPALERWAGDENNLLAAQQALVHRAHCNWAARRGEYSTAVEDP